MIRLYHGYISLKRQPTKHGKQLDTTNGKLATGSANVGSCPFCRWSSHLVSQMTPVVTTWLARLSRCRRPSFHASLWTPAQHIEWPWVAHGWPMSGPWVCKVVLTGRHYFTYFTCQIRNSCPGLSASAPWRRLCWHPWAEPMLNPREDVPHVLRTKIKCKAPTIGSTDINCLF